MRYIEDDYQHRSTIVTGQVPWMLVGNSANQSSPRASWIASLIMRIASISPVKACANSVHRWRA